MTRQIITLFPAWFCDNRSVLLLYKFLNLVFKLPKIFVPLLCNFFLWMSLPMDEEHGSSFLSLFLPSWKINDRFNLLIIGGGNNNKCTTWLASIWVIFIFVGWLKHANIEVGITMRRCGVVWAQLVNFLNCLVSSGMTIFSIFNSPCAASYRPA